MTVLFLCSLSLHRLRNASKLAMRHQYSCSISVVTESPSSIAVSFTTGYVLFESILCVPPTIFSVPHLSGSLPSFPIFTMFSPMLVLPYETTMAGKPPTYVGPSGPIPMQTLTSNGENFAYLDPTTNSNRLPPRPRDRSALEKTYARWCCGSIFGIIA